MKSVRILLFIAGALSAFLAVVQAGETMLQKRLQIIQTDEPKFPRLAHPTLMHGEARIVIQVDADGVLRDTLVVGFTKRAFADAALQSIKHWKFVPAEYNGVPTPVVTELNFNFESTGVVVNLSVSESVAAFYYWWEKDSYDYHPVVLKEIDRIPTPSNVVAPAYPQSLADKGVAGEVEISFYIDEAGKVRMPAISKADNMILGELALTALNQWSFEPPTRKGNAVLVKATQKFKFTPAMAKAPLAAPSSQ